MRNELPFSLSIVTLIVGVTACASSPDASDAPSSNDDALLTRSESSSSEGELELKLANPPPVGTYTTCLDGCFNAAFDCEDSCNWSKGVPQSCLNRCDSTYNFCVDRCGKMYPH